MMRHRHLFSVLLVPITLVVGIAAWVLRADVGPPSEIHGTIAATVAYFLQHVHLSRKPLDDTVSREFFTEYIEDLDPGKMYFTKADIEEFRVHELQLDDAVKRRDVQFGFDVFNRYLKRVEERVQLVTELLDQGFDFNIDEYLVTDPDALDYPATEEEIRDRWRKRLKYEVLREMIARDVGDYEKAVEKVRKRYASYLKSIRQTKPGEVLEMYLSALAGVYDPHTSYMSPDSFEEFNINMRLHLEGIGARLRWEDGYTIVEEVLPGGPAARDGRLKPGDKIIGVAQGDEGEFEDVIDRRLPDVVKLIRGPRGTVVRLRVIPANGSKPVVIRLVRDKVDIQTQAARGDVITFGSKPDGTPYRFGVIRLPSFYLDIMAANQGREDARSTTRDVRAILESFKAWEAKNGHKLDGLILDLRFNGGGALTEAISMVGLFIDTGPVVQVKNYRGDIQTLKDREPGTAYDGPMMVLVNRFSASASEIFAGAMKDYRRALIVGDEHTHGKGTVQTIIDLDEQLFPVGGRRPRRYGALKITIQEFFRVNGDSTQNRGVHSDIVLPSAYDHMEIGERYLDHALPFSRVQPTDYQPVDMVNSQIIARLRHRSEERVAKSEDFQKLIKRIEVLEARRKRKTIPLHIEKYRAEVEVGTDDEDEELLEHLNGSADDPVFDTKNFYEQEVLQIMVDYVRLLQESGLAHRHP